MAEDWQERLKRIQSENKKGRKNAPRRPSPKGSLPQGRVRNKTSNLDRTFRRCAMCGKRVSARTIMPSGKCKECENFKKGNILKVSPKNFQGLILKINDINDAWLKMKGDVENLSHFLEEEEGLVDDIVENMTQLDNRHKDIYKAFQNIKAIMDKV